MRLYDLLKRATLRSLPEPLLQPLKKRHYARVLDGDGTAEPEAQLLPHLVHAGEVVMDLGANFGSYTTLLSKLVGEQGTVISVEPVPPTCDLLRYSVEHHGLANVKVVAAAVSDREGTVIMEVPRYPSGGENYYQAAVVDGDQRYGLRRFTVPATTVDAICRDPVDFIKCDVEGHEAVVVRGARRTIQSYRPAWLVEVSRREVLDTMQGFGYEPFLWDGAVLRRHEVFERSTNFFFLTGAHRARLEAEGVQVS